MEFNPYLAQAWAVGKYTTVGAAMVVTTARNCALARTGVGVSTVTLDKQIDSNEGVLDMSSQTNSAIPYWADTSDSVKTITCLTDAAAAVEAAIAFVLWRISGGAGR